MKKLITAVSLAVTLSAPALSSTFGPFKTIDSQDVYEWVENQRGALTVNKNGALNPVISESSAGESHVYFRVMFLDGKCNFESDNGSFTVENQQIKAFRYCHYDESRGTHNIEFVARTDAGSNYVISKLNGSGNVNFVFMGVSYLISTKGFTAIWNNRPKAAI